MEISILSPELPRFHIRVWEWVRGWLQWRLDGWLEEQAGYQARADALLAEAQALREEAVQKDQLAVELREEADRLEAEAVDLRAEAEQERVLADEEAAESADYARQAEAHRNKAGTLDSQAQAREDEARPLADRAQALRAEAAALTREADEKTTRADANEQEAEELTELAATKRGDADDQERRADTLNEEAATLYTEADALQIDADAKQAEAGAAQQQADEFAELADDPTVATDEQVFVYNEAGRLIGRYDESGEAVREYFRLGNTPAAVAANGDLYYIHSDHLGTPRAVSQPNGADVWVWVSDAFGDSAPNEDTDSDGETFTLNLRHPGQYFDAETGTHYNYFRAYVPAIGRYISSDPIGLPGGLNTYGYAEQNPLIMIDPLGLSAAEAGAGMGAAMREGGEAAEAALECRDIWCSRGRYPGPFDTIETCLEINPSVAPMCADFCRALTRDDPDFSTECVNNQSCGPDETDARRS